MQKETLSRQYTLLISELEITLENCQYRILLYNNTSLANAIGSYFSESNTQPEIPLLLDALLYGLEELPDADVGPICELMKKIDPASYASLSLEDFIETFAFNGEIIKKALE